MKIGMLLEAVHHLREEGGNARTLWGKLYGQEKNLTTSGIARINLYLHGIEDFQINRDYADVAGAAKVVTLDEIIKNDWILRIVRFPGWQQTIAGDREVKQALRKTLLKYKLHQEQDLFDRAYQYIKLYY